MSSMNLKTTTTTLYEKVESALDGLLKPESFGFGEKLLKPMCTDQFGQFMIIPFFRPDPNAYTPLDAAVLAQEKLNRENITSEIWRGLDENRYLPEHIFLMLEDGSIVDPTPLYGLFRARHSPEIKVFDVVVEKLKGSDGLTLGEHLLSYHVNGNGSVYLSNLSLKKQRKILGSQPVSTSPYPLQSVSISLLSSQPQLDDTVIEYHASKFKEGRLSYSYHLDVVIDMELLSRKKREGAIPDGENDENLNDACAYYNKLSGQGIVKQTTTCTGYIYHNGGRHSLKVFPEEIPKLRAIAEKESVIVKQFAMNVVNAKYLRL